MNRKLLSFIAVTLLLISQAKAQNELNYYLPEGYTYDSTIPTPKDILGFEVGDWHASHDQVVSYMKAMAEASDRVSFEVIGRTYELRPQTILTITSPRNHGRLEEIKEERKKLRDPSGQVDLDNIPLVIWAGYSVHGNEPSAVNAALLAAYHFAAANEVADDLENIVILLDPAMNPDGVNRFASWVNTHKSYTLNSDPNSREFNEAWPRGRTNHYWFDLNRDWLPVQHPESRNRVSKFQEWLPNIQLDHHEMGTNSTFFFQPGIPARNHPLTPKKNFTLTEKIGQYHARFLDKIGSLYYTQESFDDFYYGKGSTYPDVQGSIGILFEQASSRGHVQESIYGPLTFAFTIRNQFTTTLSSFEAAKEMRVELNTYMKEFYTQVKSEYDEDSNKAYIFGAQEDGGRTFHLADMILQHDVEVFSLQEDITVNGVEFKKEKAYIVPLNQPQYRLIKSVFETRTTFEDSLFYDVSAWTMPMAFNLDYMALSSRILNLASVEQVSKDLSLKEGQVIGESGAYSYIFAWGEYYAPKALYSLMDKGYLTRVAHEEITTPEGVKMPRGSILISKGQAKSSDEEFFEDLQKAAKSSGVDIYAVSTGYTKGVNIGSPSIDVLEIPKIAVFVEGGVSSAEAGETWHLLDQRFGIPATLLPLDRMSSVDLSRYNVIVMSNGNYNSLGKSGAEKLKDWVNAGGTLIARGYALQWLDNNGVGSFKFKSPKNDDEEVQKSYADYSRETGAKVTGGAIFHVKLDTTHPLGYGYTRPEMYSFRNSNLFMEPSENAYANPLIYSSSPLASGYVHPTNLEEMKDTGAIRVAAQGRGKVIGFVDNPNFRAFWFGTNKLFLNAVFFGQTINSGTAR
ncbi:Secreted protein containing N-terminal Zinc-dependent carboxypeptidase related domain protein [Indibacter alkaliphilus LW1]|uniref:Secreted protein containing N-terminal Zinc-dependent carboxypeptidase related domain protein n=1 Tax=Indibacter alkaliphilus (strain CCUG 57479 / KCTC 22604 / LW1) TaxID=1189612 RepID=S2D570_INDAL|nr:M14 family metallopeptidase [Indibacter alkaliphilus]EOZ92210.1 Secreted protein containing N-terminal Zinc-dependent carboxypeptidase related domain protein [Indibacter alkaliphilus LW1]